MRALAGLEDTTWNTQSPDPAAGTRTGVVMAALPPEVWERILGFADLASVAALRRTCK